MIYGVFSDVHGNYEALRAVLSFFKKNGAGGYICCGDIAGYGAQASECVDAITPLPNLHCVMGNHDAALVGRMDLKWFNPTATAAILYNRHFLRGEQLEFIANLPELVEREDFTLVHGSPKSHLKEYLLSELQFMDNLRYWKVSPCFIGHSHMPIYFALEGDARVPATDFLKPMHTMRLDPEARYIINPGSVGQPRDSNPLAACGLYDSSARTFELFRVEYDVEKAKLVMREAGLPPMLVERLSLGF